MRLKLVCLAILLLKTTATAQNAPTDLQLNPAQLNQAMLLEVRQLRLDLQTAVANIQRVQIAMYRIQAQGNLLDRATQRVEQARGSCAGTEWERKRLTTQIEQLEATRRSSSDQAGSEAQILQLKSMLEQAASREQECQVERIDAETQFRAEQAKMNDFQDQLERLDKTLAGYGRR
jgi:hypothetical protein